MKLRRLFSLGLLAAPVVFSWACGGEPGGGGPAGTPGPTGGGSAGAGVGPGAGGSAPVAGNASSSSGAPAVAGAPGAGAGPINGGGAAGTPGAGSDAGGSAGTSGSGGGGSNPDNPGNYPDPPRPINIQGNQKVSINFAPSAADPQASGATHTGEFDPSKPLQKKLVLPLGGVNSSPWKMGWAVDRGYHVLTVDLWNDYPKDPGYPEYLESWSGEELSGTCNQSPANSVMARVKAGLEYLQGMDAGSDWGYYLDASGEVRWNDVIVFGYSFGGQMGVAAAKYVALDRIIITSAPNVPIDSPWLKQESKTPGARIYVLSGNKDGEHQKHMDEAALIGVPGDVINITQLAPPYATNRLEVDDGHSSFCGRPFNDGMIDWDRMCEFMFHTQK
jgi:hypothetical protein